MISQRKIGTILSYVYLFLSNTISLFYTPIYLGMLGQTEYGLISTAGSLTSYLSLLSMGIGGSYIRFNAQDRASGDKEREYRTNGMFQTIYFFVAGATILIGAVLVFVSSYIFKSNYNASQLYEIKLIMICTILQFAVTFCFNTTAMALQAYEKFLFLRVCSLIMCVCQPILNLIVLYFGGKAVAISVCSLIISIITYTAYYIFAKEKIGLKFKLGIHDKKLFKNIFIFSSFLFLNSITDQLNFSVDSLLLSVISGPIIVAIYTVGSTFKGYFLSFSISISSVFSPHINKVVAENKDLKELDNIFIRVGRVQFYIVSLILSGYIFFGKQFIVLWVTKDYADAYIIGLYLMLAVFVPAFQNVGLEIQKAKNMHKARSIVYFFIAICNVGLTIPMSKLWQGKGAALATLICMFFGTVVFMNIYNYKKVGIDIPKFWLSILKILPGFIIPVISGIIMNYFININSYLILLITVIAYCAIYFASIWFFSMNDYEKDLFSKPIKRILKKYKN